MDDGTALCFSMMCPRGRSTTIQSSSLLTSMTVVIALDSSCPFERAALADVIGLVPHPEHAVLLSTDVRGAAVDNDVRERSRKGEFRIPPCRRRFGL